MVPSKEEATNKPVLINDLDMAINQQLSGEMDEVCTRAYWKRRLPGVQPEPLAEALSRAISRATRNIRDGDYK